MRDSKGRSTRAGRQRQSGKTEAAEPRRWGRGSGVAEAVLRQRCGSSRAAVANLQTNSSGVMEMVLVKAGWRRRSVGGGTVEEE